MKIALILAAFTLVTGSVRAQVSVYPITLRAYLNTESDTGTNGVVKLNFNQRALTPSDRLVLVLDEDDHSVSLGTVNSENEVTYLASSNYAAFLSNGQFGANLEFTDLSIVNDNINALGTGAMQVRGTVNLDGKGGIARLKSAQLLGVFNDSVNGNTVGPDALIKGEISAAGQAYDVDELTFP
jgi:hypothetical protein